MSLNARDQRELEAIEHHLSGSDPKLALMLATFTRLTADEEMPVRERLRAGWHRQRRDRAWLLLALLIGLVLVAVAVAAAVSSGGKRACSAWATACAGRVAARAATQRLASPATSLPGHHATASGPRKPLSVMPGMNSRPEIPLRTPLPHKRTLIRACGSYKFISWYDKNVPGIKRKEAPCL